MQPGVFPLPVLISSTIQLSFVSTDPSPRLNLESGLELWEMELEPEKAELCCQALDIRLGDDVIYGSRGKSKRIRLPGASLLLDDEGVYFHLWGKRFRKDGLIGKRDEYLILKDEKIMPRFP